MDQGFSSVTQHIPAKYEVLSSILNIRKQNKTKKVKLTKPLKIQVSQYGFDFMFFFLF